MPMELWVFVFAALAGLLGAMLGLGGGMFLVPALTLALHIPMRQVVATSLLAVIATSTAGTSIYVRNGQTDVRMGFALGTATVVGAIVGGFMASRLSAGQLKVAFAAVTLYAALSMLRGKGRHPSRREQEPLAMDEIAASHEASAIPSGVRPKAAPSHGLLSHLRLAGSYEDKAEGRRVVYVARRVPLGLGASFLAGYISALLGIGGGAIQVPLMHLVMDVPLKVAVATSNFMVGITAAASALVYYVQGFMVPTLAPPAVMGVFLGARAGAAISQRLKSHRLNTLFAAVLLYIAVQMLLSALR